MSTVVMYGCVVKILNCAGLSDEMDQPLRLLQTGLDDCFACECPTQFRCM